MKNFLAIIAGFLMVFILPLGCSSVFKFFQPATPICDQIPEGQSSTLCALAEKRGIVLDDLGFTLKMTNYSAMKIKAYTADKAIKFLDETDIELAAFEKTGLTAMELILYAIDKYESMSKDVQALFVVFGDINMNLGDMAGVKLEPYDFYMLRLHVSRQKAIASILKE